MEKIQNIINKKRSPNNCTVLPSVGDREREQMSRRFFDRGGPAQREKVCVCLYRRTYE